MRAFSMDQPRLSTFPLHKPFERQEPTTTFAEVALRLVANIYSDTPCIVGTATVLAGHLLVTARHVFTDILKSQQLSPPRHESVSPQNVNVHIAAVQVIAGVDVEYVIWNVIGATLDTASDLALLHLATEPGRTHPDRRYYWMQPYVMPFPPPIGDTIMAFGYRRGSIRVSRNLSGGNRIDLNDEAMASVGVVREIYEWKRDSASLPFPCYHVGARFDGGMSGGPVFDETGALCGIVCSNIDGSHVEGEPVSYVSTLWPLFRLMLSVDRGEGYPRGIQYPAIELARGRQIAVGDLPRLERWFAEHISPLPNRGAG